MGKKKDWDLSGLDVVGLLESIPVQVALSGKNVTIGWVNTNCPFCYDGGHHLGINLESKLYSCWICREKGSIFKLVKTLTGYDNATVWRMINEHIKGDYYNTSVTKTEREREEIVLPSRCLDSPLKLHKMYLKKRGFNHKELELLWGIKYTGQFSKYTKNDGQKSNFSFRIIIPIFMGGKLVNFTARDVTENAEEKYKNCPTDDAIYSTKNCVYGIDNVENTAIFVEGPTDAWNIGTGAVAMMGIQFTDSQIKVISKKNLKKAFILFDNEEKAQKMADKLAKELGSFIPEVYVIEGEDADDFDDPGSMDEEKKRELKNLIIGV